MSELDHQVGGTHYKDMQYQPFQLIERTGVDFFCGNVIKYVSRYKNKNGVEDLQKALHYIKYMDEKGIEQRVAYDWEHEVENYCLSNRFSKKVMYAIKFTISGYYDSAIAHVNALIREEGGDNEQ